MDETGLPVLGSDDAKEREQTEALMKLFQISPTSHRIAKSSGEAQRRNAEKVFDTVSDGRNSGLSRPRDKDQAKAKKGKKGKGKKGQPRKCARCALHDAVELRRGHTCPHATCTCTPCLMHEASLSRQRSVGCAPGDADHAVKAAVAAAQERADAVDRASLFCRPCWNHGQRTRLSQHADDGTPPQPDQPEPWPCPFAACTCSLCKWGTSAAALSACKKALASKIKIQIKKKKVVASTVGKTFGGWSASRRRAFNARAIARRAARRTDQTETDKTATETALAGRQKPAKKLKPAKNQKPVKKQKSDKEPNPTRKPKPGKKPKPARKQAPSALPLDQVASPDTPFQEATPAPSFPEATPAPSFEEATPAAPGPAPPGRGGWRAPLGPSLFTSVVLCRRCWRHGEHNRFYSRARHEEACRWRRCGCEPCRTDYRNCISVRFVQGEVEVPLGVADSPVTFRLCKWRSRQYCDVPEAAADIATIPGLANSLLERMERDGRAVRTLVDVTLTLEGARARQQPAAIPRTDAAGGGGASIDDFVAALRRWAARKVGALPEDAAATPEPTTPTNPAASMAYPAAPISPEDIKCKPDFDAFDLEQDWKPPTEVSPQAIDLSILSTREDVKHEPEPPSADRAADQVVCTRLSICLECDTVVDSEALLPGHCCRQEIPLPSSSSAATKPRPIKVPRRRRAAVRRNILPETTVTSEPAPTVAPEPAPSLTGSKPTAFTDHTVDSILEGRPASRDAKQPEPEASRFPCENCDDAFPSQAALVRHRVERHLEQYVGLGSGSRKRAPGPCLLCPADAQVVLSAVELQEHMYQEHGGRGAVACPVCACWLWDFDSVDEHLERRHGMAGRAPPLNLSTCRACGTEQPDLPAMQLHQEKHMRLLPMSRMQHLASLLQELSLAGLQDCVQDGVDASLCPAVL